MKKSDSKFNDSLQVLKKGMDKITKKIDHSFIDKSLKSIKMNVSGGNERSTIGYMDL